MAFLLSLAGTKPWAAFHQSSYFAVLSRAPGGFSVSTAEPTLRRLKTFSRSPEFPLQVSSLSTPLWLLYQRRLLAATWVLIFFGFKLFKKGWACYYSIMNNTLSCMGGGVPNVTIKYKKLLEESEWNKLPYFEIVREKNPQMKMDPFWSKPFINSTQQKYWRCWYFNLAGPGGRCL